ncbi:MAG TPA: outer membrane beta-barrel protein [Anaeromyxobacteraceae bacterium]|nr:outer membrane beta-barrel protein [Anaeromyxobacteraceae bacterium]
MLVRRTPAAMAALVFLLAAPATASAEATATTVAPAAPVTPWGVAAGMEDGAGDTGLALRLDGTFSSMPLSPRIRLSWIGSLGFTRFSDSYTDPFFAETVETSANVLKIVPAARFSIPLSPAFELYGDAGLGLFIDFWSYSETGIGGTFEDSGTEIGLMMRFAVGGTFAVSPGFRLGAELGLNPYFGDVDDETLSAMVVAHFRL